MKLCSTALDVGMIAAHEASGRFDRCARNDVAPLRWMCWALLTRLRGAIEAQPVYEGSNNRVHRHGK